MPEKEKNIIELKDIGLELKNRRKEQKKSLNDVSEKLKVVQNKIKKIEDGELIGDNFYTRVLIKKYIEELGLNFNDYSADLKRLLPTYVEETIVFNEKQLEKVRVKNKRTIKKTKQKKTKRIFLNLFLLIFVVLLLFVTYFNFKNNISNEVVNETTLLTETSLKPAKVIEKKEPTITFKKGDTSLEFTLEDVEDVKIKVVATDRVYIDYSDDTGIIDQNTLEKDDTMSFTLDNATNYTLNVGAIQNVKLYIDEQDVTQLIKDENNQNNITFKEKK